MTPAYVVKAGSLMYGTATPTSDVDYRGFYYPSTDDLLGIKSPKTSVVRNTNDEDVAYWEFRHYLNMCLSANPNVLETLFAPDDCIEKSDHTVTTLRSFKNIFLSKRVGRTYMGYATGNFKRIYSNAKSGVEYDFKDAMHLIRLVRMGLECLATGELRVRRTEDIPYFLEIRRGEVPLSAVVNEFTEANACWEALTEKSALPAEPATDTIHNVCVDILKEMVIDKYI